MGEQLSIFAHMDHVWRHGHGIQKKSFVVSLFLRLSVYMEQSVDWHGMTRRWLHGLLSWDWFWDGNESIRDMTQHEI